MIERRVERLREFSPEEITKLIKRIYSSNKTRAYRAAYVLAYSSRLISTIEKVIDLLEQASQDPEISEKSRYKARLALENFVA